MEDEIKNLLNRLFYFRELKPDQEVNEYWDYQNNLETAAKYWMLIKIEAYLSLLTKRVCTNTKVWKTVGSAWNEFDVYFHITAKGREVPAFGIKTYVTFPVDGRCQFKLEDWADGARVTAPGVITKSGNRIKCDEPPYQGSDEDMSQYIWYNRRML